MPGWSEPLAFRPLLVPRIWGGERLRDRFGKPVPEGAAIGESWEVVDRADAQSVLDERHDLHELWRDHHHEVFGDIQAAAPGEAAIVGVLHGDVACGARSFAEGEFFLCPAAAALELSAPESAEVLLVRLPDPAGSPRP